MTSAHLWRKTPEMTSSPATATDFAQPAREFFKTSYWFSLEGMRELDAVHNYVDSLPETGRVLSLSTVFAVVKNLLGARISAVSSWQLCRKACRRT